MFVSRPYVRRNSFSIREEVTLTISRFVVLQTQLGSEDESKEATWTFLNNFMFHVCVNVSIIKCTLHKKRNSSDLSQTTFQLNLY